MSPMVHLDTSFLIRALLTGTAEERRVHAWLREGVEIGISAIAWAEFLCGPVREEEVELAARAMQAPEPLVVSDAVLGAKLFNLTGRKKGRLIDCLVAATAVRMGASLATSNPADFRGMQGSGLSIVPR